MLLRQSVIEAQNEGRNHIWLPCGVAGRSLVPRTRSCLNSITSKNLAAAKSLTDCNDSSRTYASR